MRNKKETRTQKDVFCISCALFMLMSLCRSVFSVRLLFASQY